MTESAETFHGCFSVLVSLFYFKCAPAEIKYCLISVLFLLHDQQFKAYRSEGAPW